MWYLCKYYDAMYFSAWTPGELDYMDNSVEVIGEFNTMDDAIAIAKVLHASGVGLYGFWANRWGYGNLKD